MQMSETFFEKLSSKSFNAVNFDPQDLVLKIKDCLLK